MATTTNYGWTTPDDTALVKDGAAAIRTLGSSVDTSLSALNDGTSGVWTSFTPTWTNLTVGNGTVVAKYKKYGKLVHFYIRLTWGSTTSISGTVRVGFPITAASTDAAYGGIFDGIYSTTTNQFVGGAKNTNNNTTTIWPTVLGAGGTYATKGDVNATTPETWATNHIFVLNGTYEGA